MKAILPILADVANGLFATAIACYLLDVVPTWHFIVGILFAMSPDLDALPEIFLRGRVSASSEHGRDHREGLHYPAAFALFGAVFAYLVPLWGTMFLIASMLHFVNDLYGTGWGVKIFWPISKRNYKFFERRVNLTPEILQERGGWDALPEEERRVRVLVSWSHEELPSYIKKYGIDNWIKAYYLNLNWVALIEYTLFAAAVGIVVWVVVR